MTEKPKNKKGWWFRITFLAGIVFLISFIFAVYDSNTVNPPGIRSHMLVLMMNLDAAGQAYLTDNGSWPKTVNNAQLYAAMSGADSGKVYMTFKSRNISPQSEILDDWGTPLRVTRVSDTELKIESAGPDKIFSTADDITNQ